MPDASAPPAVPKTCKAAVCRNPGKSFTLELVEDYPVPTPGPGQLLLKLNCTGICHSDVGIMKCDIGLNMICNCAGHEGAGVVAAVGEGVNNWKVGDRAGIKPLWDVCHECMHCRGGDEGLCPKLVPTGGAVDGSYAEYVISPARYTTRIPDSVPDKYAAPAMCSGTTMYTAIKRSGIRSGQWLVIPGGGGGVGHWGIPFAKAQGMRVVVVDTGADKRELCTRLGAEAFVDFKEVENTADEVVKVTGGGAHVVIVVGGTAAAYKTAPDFLRPAGTQICIGLPTAGTAIAGADPIAMIFKKLTIKGSLTGNQVDADEALDFVARGLVTPQVTVRPFRKFLQAFDDFRAAKVAGRLVIDFNA